MSSMSSLFECITCSSSLSLEEVKLIETVNKYFHVPDFWKSIIISFKQGLVSVTDSFTFWLVIIFFFLKKGLNIYNYSVFNCFISFLYFKNISYVFNYPVFLISDSLLSVSSDDYADIFATSLLLSYGSFSPLTLSLVVIIGFYIFFKRFFDERVVSSTKIEYGFAVHFCKDSLSLLTQYPISD